MKGIAGVKRSLIKLLKEYNYKEISIDEMSANMRNSYMVDNTPYGNILSIFFDCTKDEDLSFHFGYDRTTKTSAAVCYNGEQTETEHCVVEYCAVCKALIKREMSKEEVIKWLSRI